MPKSRRLSVALRNEITAAAMKKAGFAEAKKDLEQKLRENGDEIYKAAFSLGEHGMLDQAPQGWFGKQMNFNLVDEPEHVEEYHRGREAVGMTKARRLPFRNFNHPTQIYLNPEHHVRKKRQDIKNQIEALDKASEKFEEELQVILHSVNTVNQLYDVWPHAKEFVPEHKQVTAVVPVTLVENVNEVLGL